MLGYRNLSTAWFMDFARGA